MLPVAASSFKGRTWIRDVFPLLQLGDNHSKGYL